MFATMAGFSPPFVVVAEAPEYIRVGDHGPRFRFRFRPICGTNLFHTEDGAERRSTAVAVGAFADRDFPPAEASVYESRGHAWVRLAPGTKEYDSDPP